MKNLALVGLSLTTLLYIGGYALKQDWLLAFIVLGLGALGLLGQQRQWQELDSPLFLAFTGLAVLGIYRDIPAVWLFLGLVAALATWDLSRFTAYLHQAGDIEAETALKRGHLRRLQFTLILSLLLGGLALTFQTRFNFGPGVFFSLLMVISLSLAVQFIRRNEV
jgi:hypothetical protein